MSLFPPPPHLLCWRFYQIVLTIKSRVIILICRLQKWTPKDIVLSTIHLFGLIEPIALETPQLKL